MPEPLKSFNAQNNEKTEPVSQGPQSLSRVSLDTWAVGVAALCALLVRVGALKHIPW